MALLVEYKRKQYLRKKDQSASPKRHNIINASDIGHDYSHPSSPNKNFLTKLPGMSVTSEDTVPKDLQPVMEAKLTSSQKNRNSGMNSTQPVLGNKVKQPNSRVTSQPNMFGVA